MMKPNGRVHAVDGWDEEKHPRENSGTPAGGRFAQAFGGLTFSEVSRYVIHRYAEQTGHHIGREAVRSVVGEEEDQRRRRR